VIPDKAVEAAARAMAPAVWGPSVWQFVAHGETSTDARDRVQRQALEDARRVLEAAAPHLMAKALDEGEVAGQDNADSNRGYNIEHKANPYRKPTP
jgi:hypothetical protein